MRTRLIAFIVLTVLMLSGCNSFKTSCEAPNNSPIIESVTCTNDVWALAENELVCEASDPDGDSLNYEWSTADGKIIGSGARMTWVSPDTMGTYIVSVKVSDSKGGEARQTVSVRVLTNADGTTAPSVTLKMSFDSSEIVTENRTVKVGTATKIICDVKDAAGKKLRYEWSAGGGRLEGANADEKTWSTVFWTAPPLTQEYTVDVTVRDEQDNAVEGRVMFDVFCCPRN